MIVTKEITINASTKELWRILADDYDKIGEWTTTVQLSTPNPDVPEGEGRVCSTALGHVKETITHKDEQKHAFTYAVTAENAPFFLDGIDNTWNVEAVGNNQSLVRMSANVKLMPVVGQLIAPFMKMRMLKGFNSILEELKYYAETGQIHPRKLEELNAKKLQTV